MGEPLAWPPGRWEPARSLGRGSTVMLSPGGDRHPLGRGLDKEMHFIGDTVFHPFPEAFFKHTPRKKILRSKKRRDVSDNPQSRRQPAEERQGQWEGLEPRVPAWGRWAGFTLAPPTGASCKNSEGERFGPMLCLHAFSPNMGPGEFPSYPKQVSSVFIAKGRCMLSSQPPGAHAGGPQGTRA